jgi:hypothetical protein
VIGGLLALISLGLLGAGGTAVWADQTQRDDAGYVTSDVEQFSTIGSALTTERTDLGSPGVGWLYSDLLGKIRIRVTPSSAAPALFVGIGPTAEVDRYLAGVRHTLITDFWGNKSEAVDGARTASVPGTQDFWVASSTGPGARTVVWDPTDGSWSVVVMNADARPGINVGADLGATMPSVIWIGLGLLVAGVVLLAGGALLIAGAIRGRRPARQGT